jgi:cell division protein FtsB
VTSATSVGAWVAIIVAVIGGMSGIAALIRTFLERPKMRADAMTLVNTAALETMEKISQDAAGVRARLNELSDANRKAEDRIDELEDREDRLVRALRLLADYSRQSHAILTDAGIAPPPPPLAQTDLDRLLARNANG